MVIRTDCYVAIMDKMKEKYPNATFIEVHRNAGSDLAPSSSLLVKAGIWKDFRLGKKRPKMPFEEYAMCYWNEITGKPRVVNFLKSLFLRSQEGETIFLVCFEKDASICHRSILKEIIDNTTYK